jgi:hypothetical protein
MSKGSTTQKSSQTNNPPAWALPILQKVGSEALNLYNSGRGYNVYRGPTVAEFAPQKLEALNRILTMTGGGTPVTNEAIFGSQNPQVAQAKALIAQQQQADQAWRAQQAAAAAAAAAKPVIQSRRSEPYVGMRGGDRGSSGYGGIGGPGGNASAGSYGWSGGGMGGHGYGGVGGFGSGGTSSKSSGKKK